VFTKKDDLFHPAPVGDWAWTETNWFSFQIPEENIDGEVYVYCRPNIGVTYAGVFVWDSFCRHFTDAYYFDIRHHLPMPKGDLDDYTLENGLRIRVLEPLRRYEVTYEPGTDTWLRMTFEAIAEAIDYNEGRELSAEERFIANHMEQPGRVRGELCVRGRRHRIDCLAHRDHSWARRFETLDSIPNLGWHVGHFDEDNWFHCWLWGDGDVQERLANAYVITNGVRRTIVSARRESKWDESGIEPREIHLELTDTDGVVHVIDGTVKNLFPWPSWYNLLTQAGLVEWRSGGRRGWGEVQDVRQVDWVIRRKRAQRR